MLQAQKQQAAMAPPMVRKLTARTLAALARELAAIERTMKARIQEHASPALRSSKGLGPVFQATVLALLPELGQLDRGQIAKLTGVAPMNRDSGQGQGSAASAAGAPRSGWRCTWPRFPWSAGTPLMKAHYQQLRSHEAGQGRVGGLHAQNCWGWSTPGGATSSGRRHSQWLERHATRRLLS